MLTLHTLAAPELDRFLERQKASAALPADVDFGLHLRQILEKACELVPSESGSILLDDPLRKGGRREENDLSFVAAFGPAAGGLPGRTLSAREGIVGKVYRTGSPHLAREARADASFSGEVDRELGHLTQSVVAVPISIGTTVCGVIELINRLDGAPFDRRDLVLLEIFASYTSSALQNALDARRAADLAKRDDLTGLANDRWMHVRLTALLAEAEASGDPLSVVFLDLDGFKAVNDTHGHLAGSQVLREMGYLLRRVVDPRPAIIARYGGDEFVVGLPGAGLDEAAAVAETIRATIAGNTFIERAYGDELPALRLTGRIAASIGVAEHRPDGSTAAPHVKESALLRRADAAMYRAKALGKNRVVRAKEDEERAGNEG